jgi:hypothetical protein
VVCEPPGNKAPAALTVTIAAGATHNETACINQPFPKRLLRMATSYSMSGSPEAKQIQEPHEPCFEPYFWTPLPDACNIPLNRGASTMSNRYRHVATGVFVPLFLAMLGFFDLTQEPRFRSFQRVDVFQLIVCGMCLGIALTGFIEFLRKPRSPGPSSGKQ